MRLVWNELTPNDRYVVRAIRPISYTEMGFLAHLYLPLVGVVAHSLYQLLLHEVDEVSGAAGESTHRGLMMVTSLPLDRILTARERLEAMGLLEVRRRENRQRDYFFEYLLKPPLSPKQFFAEDIWPVMLLNQVGKRTFEQIRSKYSDRLTHQLEAEYPYEENVTKPFYEVYHTLSASEIDVRPGSETDLFFARMESEHPAALLASDFVHQPADVFSLSDLRVNLPSNADAKAVFNKENIEFFFKLMHFYQLDSWSLGQELNDWTLFANGDLDQAAMRKRLVQKYMEDKLKRERINAHQLAVELAPGQVPGPDSPSFARICRQVSPLLLLEQVVGGRINKTFLERAEALLFSDSLPMEVVNALLLHTLHSKAMELPKAYVETIRDSWKAKQITTVDDAIKLLVERNEAKQKAVEKTKAGKAEGTPTTRKNSRTAVPQDKLPASVQRQMQREQEQEKAAATDINRQKRLARDVPELQAMLESLRNPQKGG